MYLLHLPFVFYAVAYSSIVDLGCYGSKGYTSVVLVYSEVILFRKRENASLCPSVYCIFVIYDITVSKQ